ncbi:uncharacterized protein UHO2_05559 [Ustilago hordei]|uniref:uncharacterized protein n=1 Tax=Ustilago hordei TaxID=120017 RepID=UPI001A595CE8|nr:uncharacterized protein UHO2_05559 [Ustilago hordei]SYW76842.1 related to AIF1 - mitochondrial cell death effector [Ustilago hordei]
MSSIAATTPSTIAIVGGSYVGMRLAQALVPVLPPTHRVVVVEANSHFHHLFTFPRFSVLHRGGEEKAFIPYSHALEAGAAGNAIIHAKALSIHPSAETSSKGYLKLDRAANQGSDTLEFDYLAIATGNQLREPWSLPPTSHEGVTAKKQAVETLRRYQDAVKQARNIVIVGGGAVGAQVACDIAELYPLTPSKTLVLQRFAERNINTHLGSRVVIPSLGFPAFKEGEMFEVELQNGSKVKADLVLMCTGQTPRSSLLSSFAPEVITADGFIDVHSSLQIKSTPSALGARVFALGDIANSGAAKTVRAAAGQIDVIKSNILSLIAAETRGKEEGKLELQTFTPGPSGIHLSLGLYESVKFRNPAKEGEEPWCEGLERDLKIDMGIEGTWKKWNVPEGTPWHL